MKNYMILIGGIILIFIGFFAVATALPLLIEGNLPFIYLGFGLVILGCLLSAYWFIGKLRGRW